MAQYPNLMDPAVQACPYGLYARLRREAPIYKMPETGFYLVTTYELCEKIIKQPDLFLSGVNPMALNPEGVPAEVADIYANKGWPPQPSCSTTDPPRHTWVRSILNQLFTVAKVREMQPYVEQTAHKLIDGFSDRGECEFVSAFAHPLPMIIIADQIGVPRDDIEIFKKWSDAIVEPFGMMIEKDRAIECANLVVEMQHFFKDQIEKRRQRPTDDMLTVIANARDADGHEIELSDMLSILTIDLLASGNETTTAAIASGMLKLIEDKEVYQRLKREPDLVPTFVEEVLRLESPAQGMFRKVASDTQIGGVDLKAGDILSLRFGSANRDEQKYENPDSIDLDRKKPGRHLAFGIGRHNCVGAPLARMELIVSFTVILERLRDLDLSVPGEELTYAPSFFGRNLETLPISFKNE